MKKIITLTTVLTLIISGLLISGLIRYNLAINATQQTDGSDIEITETLHAFGFDLDVFDEPTTVDYIKSNFK